MKTWHQIEPDVFVFRDSCNVYAVRGTEGRWLIINAGNGGAVAGAGELGAPKEITVLLTHHFRDHTAGAEEFRRGGTAIYAPYWERDHLAGAQPAFRSRENWLLYDLAWDNFAPIKPVPVDRWLMDYQQIRIAGLPVEVIPAPGVSLGAVSYAIELGSGRKVAFVGELIHGPGRLARLSPLQYHYNDLTGGENILLSWHRVFAANPAIVFPSLGEPLQDYRAGVAQLRRNLERFDAVQPGYAARLAQASADDDVEEILPRLFRAKKAVAETHFIVGRSGKVLALDYGYGMGGIRFPNRPAFAARRTLLHSMEGLKRVAGAVRIDTVLATHYHDDHIGGVQLLQRLYGTELWAGENFADLVENPADYDRPCLWTEPIKVNRRLPLGEKFYWEDVAITVYPMVGHTEYSTLLCLEFDGHRVAHTGDQLFFQDARGANVARPDGSSHVFTNHVYKNGLSLGGYTECLRHLRAFRPEIVLSGHARPYRPDETTWNLVGQAATAFDEVHCALMPLGGDEVHFGPESQAAKLQPYSLLMPAEGGTAKIGGWVLNPFNHVAQAELRIITPPAGWQAAPVSLSLAPREKRAFETTLTVPAGTRCRRQPLALDLVVAGRVFGQVAESWVTVGYDRF